MVQADVDAFDNRDCDCSKDQLSPMFRDCLTHVVHLPDFLKSFRCIQYRGRVRMSVPAWLQLFLGTQSDHVVA